MDQKLVSEFVPGKVELGNGNTVYPEVQNTK